VGSHVTASQRTVYTATVGKRRRAFASKRAAYFRAAVWLLVERAKRSEYTATMIGAGECSCRRCIGEDSLASWCSGVTFDHEKLTAYAQRVARKLRALDEYRAKATRRG